MALLDYIDGLPAACRLNEARMNDPEYARQIAEARLSSSDEEREPWSPRIAEYGLTHQMMREMLGLLGSIQQAVIASGGGTPKSIKPFPAPRTAVDKAVVEAEKKFAGDILGMFGYRPEDYL